jgi:hypothetical protein
MYWWHIGATANTVIAAAYFLIAWAILHPLVVDKQLWANKLGTATGVIFITCAVHHGTHVIHMLGPTFGYEISTGNALRSTFSFHNAAWDVFGASMGIYYWSLRATYGSLMKGAALFEDLREKQRQALEINDNIVQGLTVAKLALELDDKERSEVALSNALSSASKIITDLLGQTGAENRLGPGDLVRRQAAQPGVTGPDPATT